MTKHQQAYRKALIEKGLPEVYAHMAAENSLNSGTWFLDCPLDLLVGGAFIWSATKEGSDFWAGINKEAEHVSAN